MARGDLITPVKIPRSLRRIEKIPGYLIRLRRGSSSSFFQVIDFREAPLPTGFYQILMQFIQFKILKTMNMSEKILPLLF
jgi:hypothetical protein